MNVEINQPLVRKRELAKTLGISPRTVDAWVAQGIIPYVNSNACHCAKPRPISTRCSNAMSDEFITLLKTLRIPLLAEPEVAKLKMLQKEWKHWESRELQHAPLRIAEEQRAAYATFLDNPNAESEQRLWCSPTRF